MGGIEREMKAIEKDHLQYGYEEMSDEELVSEAKKIENVVLNFIKEDDLEAAKCELSKLRLSDRLENKVEYMDLRALHEVLSKTRGRYDSESWGIIDRIKSNDCQ